MAATIVRSSSSGVAAPRANRAFQIVVAVCGTWFVAGLLIDGWAHNHLDLSREGFFTPYHAVFYSGFASLACAVLMQTWRNRRATGAAWRASIPYGYGATLLGLGIFTAGGLLDMVWHIAFGIEQDTEALFSPTHLLLATGGAVMLSGPLRAGVADARDRTWTGAVGWLLPITFLSTLVSFFFMWAFWPGTAAHLAPESLFPTLTPEGLEDAREFEIAAGMAAIVIRSLIIAGFALWIARRVPLPFGALTVSIVVPAMLIAAMLAPQAVPLGLTLFASLSAGIVADALAAGSALSQPARGRMFSFAVPFVYWAAYLLASVIPLGRPWWSPHFFFGAPVIGGLCGLLLGIVSECPAPQLAKSPDDKI